MSDRVVVNRRIGAVLGIIGALLVFVGASRIAHGRYTTPSTECKGEGTLGAIVPGTPLLPIGVFCIGDCPADGQCKPHKVGSITLAGPGTGPFGQTIPAGTYDIHTCCCVYTSSGSTTFLFDGQNPFPGQRSAMVCDAVEFVTQGPIGTVKIVTCAGACTSGTCQTHNEQVMPPPPADPHDVRFECICK